MVAPPQGVSLKAPVTDPEEARLVACLPVDALACWTATHNDVLLFQGEGRGRDSG